MKATTPAPVRVRDGGTDAEDEGRPVSPMSQLMGSARTQLKATPDIFGVMRLTGTATLQFIKDHILQRLLEKYPRLSCRIQFRSEDGTTYFKPLTNLPLDSMVTEHRLPGADCDAALHALIAKLLSAGLPAYGDLPPWDAHVVHYEADPHRTEFVLRADHVMGDGMAYNQMIHSVLEPIQGGTDAPLPPAGAADSTPEGDKDRQAAAEEKLADGGKTSGKRPLAAAVPWPFILPKPLRMLRLLLDLLTVFFQPWDPATPIKAQGDEGGTPRTWAKMHLDVAELRAVAAALPWRCTINDLLVSIYSGGIGRYLKSQGTRPPTELRMTSFINTRGMEPSAHNHDAFNGTNNFTFVCLRVPTGNTHPAARAKLCHTALADIRGSFVETASVLLPKLLRAILPGRLKAAAVKIVIDRICIKSTIVLSNVRGPSARMGVGGMEVADLYGIIDPFMWGCMGVAFSYCGKVAIVASSYVSRVPEPNRLLACVLEEFNALKASVEA